MFKKTGMIVSDASVSHTVRAHCRTESRDGKKYPGCITIHKITHCVLSLCILQNDNVHSSQMENFPSTNQFLQTNNFKRM